MRKYISNQYLWIPAVVLLSTISMWILSFLFFDNDGWFILTNGRYILNAGIPTENPFTWLEGLDIVIQQWLWSVIAYLTYETIGPVGLYLLCAIFYVFALMFFCKIAKLYKVSTPNAVIFGTCMLLCMFPFLTIRPTFVSIVLLLWQVYILENYKLYQRYDMLPYLVLISFLEINLHAAIWAFHFVFMLPYLVPEIPNIFVKFRTCKMKRIPLFLVMIPMFLVGFLNPYGIKNMMYLFYSYGEELKSLGIFELAAPATDNLGTVALILAFIAVVWVCHHRERKLNSSFFYILCGTAMLSFSHTRNIVYFMLGFMLFSIEFINNITLPIKMGKLNKHTAVTVYLLVFAATIFLGIDISKTISNSPEIEDSPYTPVKAVAYLKEHNIPSGTHIYTGFNTGGFLEWEGYQCFMDPRPELYFESLNGKADVYKDFNMVRKVANEHKLSGFIKKYGFEYMVIDDNTILQLYLEMSDAGRVVEDGEGYKLYQIMPIA